MTDTTPKVRLHYDIPKDLADTIDQKASAELLTRTAWLRRAAAKEAGYQPMKECAA